MIRHTQVGGKSMASSMIMSQSQSEELREPAPFPPSATEAGALQMREEFAPGANRISGH